MHSPSVCLARANRRAFMKNFLLVGMSLLVLLLSGCAGTIPTVSYRPQNIVRCDGAASMGDFSYSPYVLGIVKKPNQIQNTAIGNIYIATNVSDLVKRATALELEKTGIKLDESAPYTVGGKVLQFKADDLGYSVDWAYSINYMISDRQSGKVLLDRVYSPPVIKTGKFGEAATFTASLSEIMLSGYELFIRDKDVVKLLSLPKEMGTVEDSGL